MERYMVKIFKDLLRSQWSRTVSTSSLKTIGPQSVSRFCNKSTDLHAINCFNRTLPSASSQHLKTLIDCRSLSRGCSGIKSHGSTSLNMYYFPLRCHYSTNTEPSAVLQDQSALQVRRTARKKTHKSLEEHETAQRDNVVAYAVAEEINLQSLVHYLEKQGLYSIEKLPSDVTDALHVRGKYNVEQKPKEIFVFEDGSVVFWCIPESERSAFLKVLAKYSEGPYMSNLVLYEREEIDFIYVNDKSRLSGDIIQLRNSDDGDGKGKFLEMYSFSNAMAQSVKLAIWERSLNKFVDSIEDLIEDLRKGNKIRISRRQILMKIGELFSLRHLINLSSDLLDTPDFYWDRESLEPLYRSLHLYLNISKRTRVINEKINHCCELTDLVSSHLTDAHHTRLEIMIILLILIEVIFACARYAEKFYASHSKPVKISADKFLEPNFTHGDGGPK